MFYAKQILLAEISETFCCSTLLISQHKTKFFLGTSRFPSSTTICKSGLKDPLDIYLYPYYFILVLCACILAHCVSPPPHTHREFEGDPKNEVTSKITMTWNMKATECECFCWWGVWCSISGMICSFVKFYLPWDYWTIGLLPSSVPVD